MTDDDIVALIRAQHLKGEVGFYEAHPRWFSVEWADAYVDGLGGAPYLHVPIAPRSAVGESYVGSKREGVVIRVRPTARLAKKLLAKCGYRWGKEWRTRPGVPKGWPRHRHWVAGEKP